MSIEYRRGGKPTHPENIFCDVFCVTCPRVSEENGDYLDGPAEIVSFGEGLSPKQALTKAKEHEILRGKHHQLVIREFDEGDMIKKLNSLLNSEFSRFY